MGVGKSMKIFTEAMQNSMTNFGFGSKVVTTVMGPFKWDDNLELWVNVNNGFTMPNISMQDMLAYGYGDDSAGPSSGGKDKDNVLPDICYEEISSTTGLILTLTKTSASPISLVPLYSPTNPVEGCFGRFYGFQAFSQSFEDLGVDIDITTDGTNYTTLVTSQTDNVPPATTYTVGRVSWGTTVQVRVKPNATSISNGFFPVGTTGIQRIIRLYNLDSKAQILSSRFTTSN